MKLSNTEKILLIACTTILLVLVYRKLQPGLMGNPGNGRTPAEFNSTKTDEKNEVENIGIRAEEYAKSMGWIK